ncbi:hypothetical protein RYX36_004135 [Vicia faba]
MEHYYKSVANTPNCLVLLYKCVLVEFSNGLCSVLSVKQLIEQRVFDLGLTPFSIYYIQMQCKVVVVKHSMSSGLAICRRSTSLLCYVQILSLFWRFCSSMSFYLFFLGYILAIDSYDNDTSSIFGGAC